MRVIARDQNGREAVTIVTIRVGQGDNSSTTRQQSGPRTDAVIIEGEKLAVDSNLPELGVAKPIRGALSEQLKQAAKPLGSSQRLQSVAKAALAASRSHV